MPHLGVGDRVKETTTTTGTGTINLDGAVEGYQTFVAGIGNGHETYYSISNRDADEWEVGYGTITDAATDTLSRTTVISSSNGGSLVNFSAGTKDVICTLPSDRSFVIDDEANVSVSANVTATSFDGSGAALTALNASNVSSGTLADARLTGNVVLTSGATFTGNVALGDDDRLKIGTGADLQIWHDGSDSFIIDTGTGDLNIRGASNVNIQSFPTENMITCQYNGAVELYYDNSKKLETVTGGVTITGTASATTFSGSGASLTTLNASNVSSGTLDNARLSGDVVLTSGATFTGNVDLGDSVYINLGAANDLQIVHNHVTGVSSVTDTQTGGTLNLEADTVRITGTPNVNSAYTLPTSDGTSGQVLTTNGSGALTFQTPTVGDITGVTAGSGLTGGGTSGDVTLNVGAGTGVTVGADTVSIGQDVATSASPTFAGATFTANVSLGDSDYINFGASNDLYIGHNGTDSFIRDQGAGDLYIEGATNINFRKAGTTELLAKFTADAATELYYDNSKKFQTASGGVVVTGVLTSDGVDLGDSEYIRLGASQDLQLFHSGTNSHIYDAGTGALNLSSDGTDIRLTKHTGGENMLKAIPDGAVELYYDNVKKFETTSAGATVNGALTTTSTITSSSGTSSFDTINISGELNLTATGTENIIDFAGTEARLRWLNSSPAFENIFRALNNGAVELYHNGSKKFETTAAGVFVTGNISTGDNGKFISGTSADLQIYHDGSNSYIMDSGTGGLDIRGHSNIWLRSYNTGETFLDCTTNGAVALYYDGSKKFETTSAGVTATGTIQTNSDLNVGGEFNMTGSGTNYMDFAGTALHARWPNSSPGFESIFYATINAGIDLRYNGSKKFETTSSGIDVTGQVLADKAYIAEATLTDGATISWNMSTQSVAKVTLGGNRTLAAPTNGSTGQFCSINVIQDGTGSRTLTWNAVFEFKDDTAPTLTTTGGKGDIFVFRYNGSKWLEVGRNLNISQS